MWNSLTNQKNIKNFSFFLIVDFHSFYFLPFTCFINWTLLTSSFSVFNICWLLVFCKKLLVNNQKKRWGVYLHIRNFLCSQWRVFSVAFLWKRKIWPGLSKTWKWKKYFSISSITEKKNQKTRCNSVVKEASLLQLKLLNFFPHIFEEVFSLRFFLFDKGGYQISKCNGVFIISIWSLTIILLF